VRYLRLGAWGIFLLDSVVLLQLLYNFLDRRGGSEAEAAVRGLLTMLGPALLGLLVLIAVSSRLRSRAGLCIAIGLGAVPLFFAINAIIEGYWLPAAPAP
jgi:hypothetical protein